MCYRVMNIKMSCLMLSNSCGRNPLIVDDFLLPFWKNYQNEVVDLFFLVIQNIVAGTAAESRKTLNETCLQWKIQFLSNSPVILLQFGSPSNKIALNDLFVAIQNIVAGTATVSKRMLNGNCIEWKIQLPSKSPVILLQYELKAEKNDIVHLIPVTDYQEVDVNVKTVDDKNIGHKNFKTYDEIREKPSVLCNFKEELPELLSVLNDKEVTKDKQLSFSSIQENQTKLLSYEMNINTTSNSTKKSNKSESSSVERRSLGDICVNLPSGSNVPVLQFGKQNGGDEINSEMSEVIVSNNVVSSYNIKIYPNRNCKKTFKRKKKKHEKSFHCEACDKSFTTSRDLTYHNKIHTGENPCKSNERKRNQQKKSLLYCEYCGKSFRFLSKLTAHKRTHTGEKPYKCEICNKCFPNSNYITVHKRIHTGQKPFPCDICNKSFIHTSSLNAHKRTHSGEKPFKCDMCTKSFAQSSGLRVHKRIHTGEKPYKCEICNKSFAYSNIMIYHKLNLHS